MTPVQVTTTDILEAENSILREQIDVLRRSLAQHSAALTVLQAEREEGAADAVPE